MVFLARHHQRRDTRLVGRIFEHRPLLEQQLGDRQAAGKGRRVERREAARIARHDVGALAQQQFRDGKLVVERSSDEEGCLVAGPAVDIGTAGQGLLDGGLIAGSDGVEQRIARGCRCRGERQHEEVPTVHAFVPIARAGGWPQVWLPLGQQD